MVVADDLWPYDRAMTTLAEVRVAVGRLSAADQAILLQEIESRVRPDREAWMRRLDVLRQRLRADGPGLTVEHILAESRAE